MRRVLPSLLRSRSARLAWTRASKSSEYKNLTVTGFSKPRYFSSSSSQDDLSASGETSFPEVPAFPVETDPFNFTTDPNYFSDSAVPENSIVLDGVDAVIAAAPTEAVVSAASELGFSPPHLVIRLIENVHLMAEIPYWETIVLTTIALRIFLLPVAIYTTQSASRMAHARPKIIKLQTEFSNHPNMMDPVYQDEFRRKMAQLLEREQVNPARTIIFPFLQIPILISFFFGLRQLTEHLPDAVTGGTMWFTDLSATDQYYIFPVLNAVSFMAMIEIGTYGVPINKDVEKFKWVLRALAVAIVPLTASMPQSVLVYWAANNSISMVQATVLKNKRIRKYYGILDPPIPDPNQPAQDNPFAAFMGAVEKQEKIIRDAHNAIVNKNASANADANGAVESRNVPVNRVIEITPNKSTTTSSDISGSPGTGAEKENK